MNKTILSARAVDNFPINQVNGQNGSFATTNGSIAVMRPRGRRDANGNYPTDFFYVEATGKTSSLLKVIFTMILLQIVKEQKELLLNLESIE